MSRSEFEADRNARIQEVIQTYDTKRHNAYDRLVQLMQWVRASRYPNYIKRRIETQIRNGYRAHVDGIIAARNSDIQAIQGEQYVPPPAPGEVAKVMKSGTFVGINYTGSQYALRGCVTDAEKMAQFTQDHGWKTNSSVLLTDDSSIRPTRTNILKEFAALLKNTGENEVSFFYYSGHGSYTADLGNDEATGYDQVLFPIDYNPIVDDELKHVIQANMKSGAGVIMLMDCCFSGTAMDLKYTYVDSLNNGMITENPNAQETPGDIIMISGCHDLQTSAEATIFNVPQGAVTWAFIECIKTSGLTWHQLLIKMRDLLKRFGFTQIPQLTSGRKIDPHSLISKWIQGS